jgi:predicted ribosomally synthesized peptide with SipW-like signal peptide
MSRSRKMLRSLLIAACAAGLATYGTFSAFSATTQNDGNQISAGTVVLGDNDSDGVLYSYSNIAPDDVKVKCITVTYSGNLPANVRLYVPAQPTTKTLAPYVNLKIEAGVPGATPLPDCTGSDFSSAQTLFNDKLSKFLDGPAPGGAYADYASGLVDFPGNGTAWTNAATQDSVTYKFTVSVDSDNNAAGKSVTAHTFKWEARNQ